MAVTASEFLEWAITFGIYPPTGGGGGLTPIAAGTFLSNITGGTAIPAANALSAANLGLGSMASQAATNVTITGGSATLTEITAPFTYAALTAGIDLAVVDSLTAFEFRTNPGSDITDGLGLASYTNGMTFSIKNTSGGDCYFIPFAGEHIDTLTSLTIPNQSGYLITKNPDQWSIIASNLADTLVYPISIALGGTGTTSVTVAPAATAWAGWDANKNLSANSVIPAYATTVTAAGTTTLTVASKYQQFFTGSTTQTVLLPVTSTLELGQPYLLVNNSSGAVTVESSGANAIQVMAANTSMIVTCTAITGTTAASWSAAYLAPSVGGSAAGSTNYIQFNTSGAFAAINTFQYNPITNNFTMGAVPSIHSGVTQSVGFGSAPYLGGSSAFIFGDCGAGNGSTGVVMFGFTGNNSSGNYSFTAGYAAYSGQAYNVAIGAYATPTNAGSHVYSDQSASPASDTAVNQWCGSFAGGYNFNLSGSGLAASIDASGNLINHLGIADQSYSYQVVTDAFNAVIAQGMTTLTLIPAATIATGFISLGSVAPVDGQVIRVNSVNTVTALTIYGASVNNPPTTILAGQGFSLIYNATYSAWNPLYQSGAGTSQIQTAALIHGTDTGIVNAAVVALAPVITSYTDGQVLSFTPAYTSTTINPTVDFGGGAIGIKLSANNPLAIGDIVVGVPAIVSYGVANNTLTLLNPAVSINGLLIPGTGAGSAIGGDFAGTNASGNSLLYSSGVSSIDGSSANTIVFGSTMAVSTSYNSAIFGVGLTISGSNNSLIQAGGTITGCYDSLILGASVSCNSAQSSFGLGYAISLNASTQFGFGANVVVNNAGSWVITDGNGAPVADSAAHQWNATFQNGFKFFAGAPTSSVLAASIDTASNFITNAGQADQSTSYQVPTTGFSIAIAPGVRTLALAPVGTLATGTIDLGSVAPVDMQMVRVYSTQVITALSFIGATVNNAPTVIPAGQGFDLQYNLANTVWNPVYIGGAVLGANATIVTPIIVGVTDGSSASAGDVGYVLDSGTANVTLTSSGVYQDIASIALPAGDFDLYAGITGTAGDLVSTAFVGGISLVSATPPTIGDSAFFAFGAPYGSTGIDFVSANPTTFLRLAAPATVYLVARASWSTVAMVTSSRLWARERR